MWRQQRSASVGEGAERHVAKVRRHRIVVLAVVLAMVLAACGSSKPASTSSSTASTGGSGASLTGSLVIATQPDLGYAPLFIVEQEGWLNQVMPKVHVTWESLNSGSAMETGIISGSIDAGAGGVAPFLLGWSKGVGWKLLSSLDEMNLWLVVKPNITSFKDIASGTKIAVVAPTSIQAIILKKAAQKYLGNPSALDKNLTILSHPVSYQAFKSGSIQGALDAPPFQQEEVAAGGHVLLKSYDLFGKSTFNSVWVTTSFYNSHQAMLKILVQQIQRGVNLLNSNPDQAAQILSAYEKGSLPVAEAKTDITDPSVHYTITPHGYMAYAQFMHSIGLIDNMPASIKDLELPTLYGTNGD